MQKFSQWIAKSENNPSDYSQLKDVLRAIRRFEAPDQLEYGDYGLLPVAEVIANAVKSNKRIALYADYDVDGTMSCVSWIWFFRAIGFGNFLHYIPCRFKEGYGLNLDAVRHLVEDEGADLIITMDTGITANEEAAWCKSKGVTFVCTDHHKVQPEKMPDCYILNPKLHPDERYQEMCGCGITFVLLRTLAKQFDVPSTVWTDLLALTGMATICDVVPLNGVNHTLARMGVKALGTSRRPVLKKLIQSSGKKSSVDESDVGFKLGPRINAVGRLNHADVVVEAFVSENPDALISFMEKCNEKRKKIQQKIVEEARDQADKESSDGKFLFLGGNWHPGVVGIAASKIAEDFWRPTWLFEIGENGICKGSARSIPGFDVTDAMTHAKDLFTKFGGHAAAGGFAFPVDKLDAIKDRLRDFCERRFTETPALWNSSLAYDCAIDDRFWNLTTIESLSEMKPFGHGFEEPRFLVEGQVVQHRWLNDKSTGKPRHTSLVLQSQNGRTLKVLLFNRVLDESIRMQNVHCILTLEKNVFRGETSLNGFGVDIDLAAEDGRRTPDRTMPRQRNHSELEL